MLTATIAFFLGVLLAPVVRPLLRPLFVELIRAALMTVDEVQRMSAHVRENIEDAAAEAKAEREAKLTRAAAAPPDIPTEPIVNAPPPPAPPSPPPAA